MRPNLKFEVTIDGDIELDRAGLLESSDPGS